MVKSIYTLAFSAFPGIATRRFEQLVLHFASAKNAWTAEDADIIAVLKPAIGQKFCEFRKTFDIEKYAAEIAQKHIQWFVPKDTEYPSLLKKLVHPPFILFAKGNVPLLQNNKTIGVVGTRKVTEYGRQVTEMFVRDLVQNNFTIVSGMALGVDGIAHTTALANGGKTIAVLGSGVDIPTPREHANVYRSILENNGLIVSTFSPGEDASKGSFPARNAIIAGLSLGVVLTEGAADSGSLITADYARKFGRLLFAVPGQITSHLSQGTNKLIQEGAVAVSSVSDIIEHLHDIIPDLIGDPKGMDSRLHGNDKIKKAETKEEQEVLDLLEKSGPLHFDEIVRYSGKDSKKIGSLLSLLELQGVIQSNSEGKYYL